MDTGNRNMEFDPIFTIGIVGKCKLDTLQEVKHFFESLEEFEIIYIKTTKGRRLWIQEDPP